MAANEEPNPKPILGAIAVLLGAAAIGCAAWLHVLAGRTFPPPWDDEAHFIVPALELLRNGTLSVPLLNAPEGIFWLPHGYYVFLAPVLSLPGDVLTVARWSSFASVVVFASSMTVVGIRRGVPHVVAAAAAGAWLLLPRVVVAGNVVRMEAALMAAAGIALVLAERERWPAAVAVGILGALLHPIGALLAALILIVALFARRQRWAAGMGDWLLVAVAVTCVAANAVYVASHADVVANHLAFQVERKAERDAVIPPFAAAVLAFALAGIAVLLRRIIPRAVRTPFVLLVLLISAGGMLVAIVGQELWYEVLGVEFATALLVLVILLTVSWTRTATSLATMCLMLVAAAAAWGTLHTPLFVYDFRIQTGHGDDYAEFVDQAIASLREYDRMTGPRQVVLVDSQSTISPYLHGVRWNRLQFVQATPVTPFPPEDADLLLVAPGPTASPLYNEWGPRRTVISTSSPRGQFKLLVMPH